jgi:hypothetical protein
MLNRKGWNWIVGGCAVWPLIYIALHFINFVVFTVYILFAPYGGRYSDHPQIMDLVDKALIFLMYPTGALVIVMVLIFIIILWRMDKINVQLKLVWSVFLIIGNVIAIPLFFSQFILTRSKVVNV